MGRKRTNQMLLLILFLAAVTGVAGLATKDIQTWDEGSYYGEGRFVAEGARAAAILAVGKVLPGSADTDLTRLKRSITGLPPSMGRPVNTLLNAVAILLMGEHPWVPALIAILAGLGCIYLVFLTTRQLSNETTGLLAAFLLTVSPYFLPYRRLGMCEASGACLALLTLWLLVREAREPAGRLARRHSCLLGVLCGLSFGANTRTLLLLPAVLAWRMWHRRQCEQQTGAAVPASRERWWAHGLRVLAGFAAMIALYQLPYLLVGPLAARMGLQFETYFAQLQRFATAQRALGRLPVAEAYGAPAYFFLYNEGPALLLSALGLLYSFSRRGRGLLVLPSLLVLPLMQSALLIPFARYQSWLLPTYAMLSAAGLFALSEKAGRRSPHAASAVLVVCLLGVTAYSYYRAMPVLVARSLHPAALQWCRAHGAQRLLDTQMSAAFSHPELYRLSQLRELPVKPREAVQALQQFASPEAGGRPGRVMVIVETQQFMDAELLMNPQQYEQSAAALLRRHGKPLWVTHGHLRGLFPFLCFEHNRTLWETLETVRRYQSQADELVIYDGAAARQILQESTSEAISR